MADQTQKLGGGQAQNFVRLVIDKDRRYKLRFKHAQLRNAVLQSGGKSIGELLSDPFGGWPYLLAEGHRYFNSTVTIENASDWIDAYVETPDPQTNAPRDLTTLRKVLDEALMQSGFVKIKDANDAKSDDDEDGEGNAPPEAND